MRRKLLKTPHPVPCTAIIRRVLLLVLAGAGLGTALFYLGLKYAFPETP